MLNIAPKCYRAMHHLLPTSSRNTCKLSTISNKANSQSTPVLISGAGPVGLTLALLLSNYNIPSTLIERRPYLCGEEPKTSTGQLVNPPAHPRAHVLNSRTMELFRAMDLEDQVRELAPPENQWSTFRYCQSLVGDDYSVDHHTKVGNDRYENLIQNTPSFITHVSQPKLEALLLKKVRDRSDLIQIHTNTQVDDFVVHDDNHTTVKLSCSNAKDANKNSMNCFFLAGCDGANSIVRQKLNIPLKGEHALERFASIHFTTPHLAPLMGASRASMLYFVMNPKIIACVVGHDVYNEGSFVAQIPVFPPHTGLEGKESNHEWQSFCENAVDACIGTNGLEKTIHSSRVWSMDSLCATTFHDVNSKRIFLLGDSAHQLPPSGGFGLNTGLQDAHNLAWKMAFSYNETKKSSSFTPCNKSLMESYTNERRPIALSNMSTSEDNYERGLKAPSSVGLNRDLIAMASSILDHSTAASILPLHLRTGLLEMGATIGRSTMLGSLTKNFAKKQINHVVQNGLALPLLFPKQDIGYRYDIDSTRTVNHSNSSVLYTPEILDGCRLPHIWLKCVQNENDDEAVEISSIDLVDLTNHILLKSNDSEYNFDERLYYIPKNTKRIHTSDYISINDDDRNHWNTLWNCDLGALLIRPDGHITKLRRRKSQ